MNLRSQSHLLTQQTRLCAKEQLFSGRKQTNQPQINKNLPDEDSNTYFKAEAPAKLKYYDDQATRNNRIQVKQRISGNASSNKKKNEVQKGKIISKIQRNEKVEKIINSKGLREKYGHLLPNQHKLPIGFQHQHLLKKIQCIDRTLAFLIDNRSTKSIFFQDLRKIILESIKITINITHLQQILFLNENYYNLKWQKNDKNKKYDILIQCKLNSNPQSKMSQMRALIIAFISSKQKQFLQHNKIIKIDYSKWHPNFKYQNVIIPMKSLPVHPQNQNAQIRNLKNSQINKIKNPQIRKLFSQKKQQSEVKSFSSCDVAKMIFSGVPSKKIQSMILEAVRDKQKRIQAQQIQSIKQQNIIDKKMLIMLLQQIQMVFISKNVSNIFKSTLIEILDKRLRFANSQIQKYVQFIINYKEFKQLGLMKELLTSQKLKVLQLDKSKVKLAKQYIEKCQELQI